MGEWILEIGTEEIPADYIKNGKSALKTLAEAFLTNNRIGFQALNTYATPRRLVVTGEGVSERQEDMTKETTGPPKKVAFDDKGNPTKAAYGFAKKQGVDVRDIKILETPKGEYAYVKKTFPGRATREILSESLVELISDIPWPKSMRWGEVGFYFVRPIHWILALFNKEVIPFEVAGVKSGRKTMGHRFMAPGSVGISFPRDYIKTIRQVFVIVEQNERKRQVKEAIKKAAGIVSGIPMQDNELLSIVVDMVEYPSAVCGHFDESFLELPDPVLITAMKKHQRYFPVYDQKGRLLPHFVAVNNTVARDENIVRRGHERVLRARLADADFFFKEDRKRPIQDRLEDLKGVIYQKDLGTSFEKVERFTRLAEYLAEKTEVNKKKDILLAARLSKCDLVTEMVTEFPSLQGTMGEIYAMLDGHPPDVCKAVSDHYLPSGAESELPKTMTGAIVGMADRMDTIAGCFVLGMEPSGTSDPYALRRHALGIIRVIRDKRIMISMADFVAGSCAILRERISFDSNEISGRIIEFIKERFKNMLLTEGLPVDCVDAVLAAESNNLVQVEEKVKSLVEFRKVSKDFESLTLSFKRIMNILKNSEPGEKVNPNLFQDQSEIKLWRKFQDVQGRVKTEIEAKKYYKALETMIKLVKPVDEFFSEVMVMAEDQNIKENRLSMLNHVKGLFLQMADFSIMSV